MRTAAYDLSQFATKTAADNPVRVASVNPNRRTRSYTFRVAFCASLLFFAMSLTVYNNMLLTEARARVVSRSDELSRLQSEFSYLSWQLENMISLKNAAEYAESELGLVRVAAGQIEYINLHCFNRIEEGEAAFENSSLWERILRSMRELFNGQ